MIRLQKAAGKRHSVVDAHLAGRQIRDYPADIARRQLSAL